MVPFVVAAEAGDIPFANQSLTAAEELDCEIAVHRTDVVAAAVDTFDHSPTSVAGQLLRRVGA